MALAALLEQVCENAFQLGGHTDETGGRSCDVCCVQNGFVFCNNFKFVL